jgi:flagellar biosynthesis protein FlhB
MSEDRTQAPTKRRRQQARERGLVARSPDLTGATVLLAAVVLLGIWGERLVERSVALVRESFGTSPELSASPEETVSRIRRSAEALVVPWSLVLGGVVIASIAVHQAQVQGLWAPGLLAPDFGRLWGGAAGASVATRAIRGAWTLAKAVAVIVVSVWAIQSDLPAFHRLSGMETHALARVSGSLLKGLAIGLSVAMLVLGAIDFFFQWQSIEAHLRLTHDEYREEQKAVDGDPAIRARRIRVARSRNATPPGSLDGAAVVLTGPGNLVVVLAGGPPPTRVTVRASARGAAGASLRRSAERAGLRAVESPALARHFARGAATGRSLSPDLAAELGAAWNV